jgi:hypothetical protein
MAADLSELPHSTWQIENALLAQQGVVTAPKLSLRERRLATGIHVFVS